MFSSLKAMRTALTALLFIIPISLSAQWSSDPSVNTVVVSTSGNQTTAKSVSDGYGGIITVWLDTRNGGTDVYVQKLNGSGVAKWGSNGLRLSTSASNCAQPAIVGDGAGGAVVAWKNDAGGGFGQDVYGQRIDSAGNIQWTADGMLLTSATNNQYQPSVCKTGDGYIFTWTDQRSGGANGREVGIWAQKFNDAGTEQWAANGVLVNDIGAGAQTNSKAFHDGSNGAVVVFDDETNSYAPRISAQRVNSSGVTQWGVFGVQLNSLTNSITISDAVADDNGGAIVGWNDPRNANGVEFFAQRISNSGSKLWGANGVQLMSGPGFLSTFSLASDGAGGAWAGYNQFSPAKIYLQRVNSSGAIQFAFNGVLVSDSTNFNNGMVLSSAPDKGVVAVWNSNLLANAFAQRVDSNGNVLWTANGVAISTASGNQNAFTIVPDRTGGAIMTFVDTRNGNQDIYAQQISGDGTLGNGTAPGFEAPTLSAPANNAVNQSLTPTLNWTSVVGANGYQLLVATDAGFTSIVYNSGFGTDTTYTFGSALNYYTTYYWKVRSKNSSDTSAFTSVRNFRTLLATPALASPSNGAVFQSLTPQLKWGAVSGSTSYTLLVATNNTFTSGLQTFSSVTDTQYTFGSALNNYTVYYWKVSATDGTDTTSYSSTRNFRTLISTPVQASPADGAIVVPVLTNFKWYTVTGATSYRLQVATDAAFTNIVVNTGGITDTSHTLGSQLNSYTNYYWRVRASEGANNTVYTGGWTFQTAIASPVTVSPANTASGITIHPTLVWRSVNGATRYQVQFSKNLAFTQVLYDSVTVDTTLYIDSILANSTTYYWRVNASNPNDTAPYVTRSFTTIEELIPLLNHPTGGQLVYSLSPVAYWNITVSSTGITYDVQYCRDTMFHSWNRTTIDAGSSIYDTLPNLAPTTTYYWRVRTKNAGGVISYSAISSFVTYGTVAAPPTASYPLTGTTVYSLNPTLYWYLGITSYGYTYDVRYKLSSSGTWNAPVSVGSSMSYTLAGLVNGESYDWQIRCMNGTDTSAWSAAQTFTTYTVTAATAPLPVISYPSAGVTVYSLAPMLNWYITESGLGVTYDLELRTDTNFTGTPTAAGLSVLYYQTSSLSAGTTYYYKVRSYNGSAYSAWTAAEAFVTYGVTGSTVPVLTYPVDSQMVYASSTSLYWYTNSAANGLLTYQVQLAADTTLAPLTLATGNTYYPLAGLTAGATYYWRVRSYNGTSYSAYSAYQAFAVAGNAGSLTPILSWPLGGVTQATTVSLNWYVNGWAPTMSYEIQYSSAADFSVATTTTSGTTSVTISGLAPGVTYYWRVRTFNGSAYSAYSSSASFVTEAGAAPVRVQAGSPVANAIVPASRIQFSWYAPVAAQTLTYELQYSVTPDFATPVTVNNLTAPRYNATGLAVNVPVYWRVRSKNVSGAYSAYSAVQRFTPATPTDVKENELPTAYALTQNYPNPFNPSTVLQYSVIKRGTVTLEVYNILGVKVATLVNEMKEPGNYTVNFNANGLASGTYIYRLKAGDFTAVRKMQLLK